MTTSGESVHLLDAEPEGQRVAVCGVVEHSTAGERLNFTIAFTETECLLCRSRARECCVASLPLLSLTRPDGDTFTCPSCDKSWAWYDDEAEGGGWWPVVEVTTSGGDAR